MPKLVCQTKKSDDLKPFAVIGLTRIYCNQSDEFCLVDVSSQDAPRRVEQLREQRVGTSKLKSLSETSL